MVEYARPNKPSWVNQHIIIPVRNNSVKSAGKQCSALHYVSCLLYLTLSLSECPYMMSSLERDAKLVECCLRFYPACYAGEVYLFLQSIYKKLSLKLRKMSLHEYLSNGSV